jgi:hypothetical protein
VEWGFGKEVKLLAAAIRKADGKHVFFRPPTKNDDRDDEARPSKLQLQTNALTQFPPYKWEQFR